MLQVAIISLDVVVDRCDQFIEAFEDPRGMRRPVIFPNQHSTWFNHEPPVEVECR